MLNKAMVIGRLGRDPEIRHTQSGKACASLNVATDESYTDRNGNRQGKTEWHRVVVWDKAAENCGKYLSRGSLVYVEGKTHAELCRHPGGNRRHAGHSR